MINVTVNLDFPNPVVTLKQRINGGFWGQERKCRY